MILVVDDEIQIGKALCRLLRRAGHRAEAAANATEALEKLDALHPDIVLSDYRMPGMDGLELLAEIGRRSPRTSRLLLSGQADLHAVTAAIDAGRIAHFLPKPWEDQKLLALLGDLLGEQARPEEKV